jgi:hypothetical protein
MTVREPSFIKAQEEEALRQPLPIFKFYGAPRSSTDEVSLANPAERIVFDAVLQTTARNLFALVESWRYPVVASTGTDAQTFLTDQMRIGYPLFARRDPRNESIYWQLNIRYFVPNRIEFDVLAFRGTPDNAVIILWLTHVGHLESVQLTDDTARATFYSYYDDPFVEYSTRIIAKHILSKIPAQIVETSPTSANADLPATAMQTDSIDLNAGTSGDFE